MRTIDYLIQRACGILLDSVIASCSYSQELSRIGPTWFEKPNRLACTCVFHDDDVVTHVTASYSLNDIHNTLRLRFTPEVQDRDVQKASVDTLED